MIAEGGRRRQQAREQPVGNPWGGVLGALKCEAPSIAASLSILRPTRLYS